jgi:type IV pilus assembly protein PilP
MMRSHLIIRFAPIFLVAILGACGNGNEQEIAQWMEETKKHAKVVVPKISEPKKFSPFVYASTNDIDPFNSNKLLVAFAKLKSVSASSIKPDLERRREPLEAFPLDTIKMVGALQKPGLNYALLQVDKTVYQIKMGNYIGQNLGIVTNVTDTEVEVKETVQDAAGDWIYRPAKLQLQEGNKK